MKLVDLDNIKEYIFHLANNVGPTRYCLLVVLFLYSTFCYYNIFQQALFQARLPPIDVIKLLKNGVNKGPSSAPEEIYSTLADHFKTAYEQDYMNNYTQYTVILEPILSITRTYISIVYHMRKFYFRARRDTPDRAFFEFTQVFDPSSKLKSPLSMAAIPGALKAHNSKSKCLHFLRTNVYPVFLAGRSDLSPRVYNFGPALSVYKALQGLQITVFALSLVLSAQILSLMFISKRDILIKSLAATYLTLFILVCLCSCLAMAGTLRRFNTTLGAFNTVVNLFQMVYTMLLGFLLKSWYFRYAITEIESPRIEEEQSVEILEPSAPAESIIAPSLVATTNPTPSSIFTTPVNHFPTLNFTQSGSCGESVEELKEQKVAAWQNGSEGPTIRQRLYEEADGPRYITTAGGDADDEYEEYNDSESSSTK